MEKHASSLTYSRGIDIVERATIIYERIAEVTSQILTAARDKDWHKVSELEAECALEVQKLRSAKFEPLAGTELQRKIASIHKILAHDREIRDLLNPWMARMDALLSGKTKPTPYVFSKPPL